MYNDQAAAVLVLVLNWFCDKVASKVRQKVGWVFRTFYTQRTDILKQLWKTLIQCHIDYCSQLHMPSQSTEMQIVEKLFFDILSKIPEVRDKNYWERLKSLQMYSQERRMERYRILYVWKILEKYPQIAELNLHLKIRDQEESVKYQVFYLMEEEQFRHYAKIAFRSTELDFSIVSQKS